MSGKQPVAAVTWDELPQDYQYKKAVNWQIPTAIAACVLVVVVGFFHSRHVNSRARWRVVTSAAAYFLGGWGAYWDIPADDRYRPYFFIVVGLVSALIWFFGTASIEHSLNRQRLPKIASLQALFDHSLSGEVWGKAILRGTLVGFVLLLVDTVVIWFATRKLHGWLDGFIQIEIQPWYVGRWWPGLQIFLSALLQMIGVGLLFGFVTAQCWRMFKNKAAKIVIPAGLMACTGMSWYMPQCSQIIGRSHCFS
jgi:hypothetical protein